MTGSTIAYALRAEHAPDGDEPFLGALIRVGDRDLNVADALEAGDGRVVIAVDDHTAANALDAFTPLKRVPASDADTLSITRWDGVHYAALQGEARRRGLSPAGKREELVDRLVDSDAAIATGTLITAPEPINPNPAADDTAAAAAAERAELERIGAEAEAAAAGADHTDDDDPEA